MANLTLRVPDTLYEALRRHPEIRWSEVARQALVRKLEEVEPHWAELQPRSGLSPEALREVLRILREHFHEHAPAEYEARFEEARSLLAGRDPDDVPYVALAFALGAHGVGSEDRGPT